MLTAHHTVALTGEGAPEWVHLIPAGKFSGVDGRGPYVLKDPAAVIAASMAQGKLPIDENHSTDFAAPAGRPSPARGWIVEIEARENGLWGKVEWTPSGTQLMTEKAYKSQSPVFQHETDGTVLRLLRAGLTNAPNLHLTALNSRENPVDLAALRAALGLAETADEAACLSAITANRQAVASHASQLTAIRTAAGLDATLAPDAIVTALQTQNANASNVQTMAATITRLETKVATMTAEQGTRHAIAFVDGAIKDGKPIVSLRDHYIARHMADAAGVEKEITAMISINAGGGGLHRAGGDGGGEQPTPEEIAVAKMMGLDPKKVAAHRREREAGSAVA